MCGIVGGEYLEGDKLERALACIRHRGPDAQGVWSAPDGRIGLGHARLAIIDLDTRANQPMICPRTGNVLVFNGEIYNFRAIRQELTRLGWSFRTTSDTEVLLAAYGQWGIDCLQHFNGMFAFALYDPCNRRILLARDRVGKKPLYYARVNNELLFASEIKALLQLQPKLPRTLDLFALKEYLGLGYIPGERSIYQAIRKLKPGHFAVYHLDSPAFTTERYWTLPPPSSRPLNEAEAAEELEMLLRDSVRLRLESDVPVGVFLSGGLDSSLVAALAARENPDLVAYTASFPLARYDESSFARHVAEWIGINHHQLPVEAHNLDTLERLAQQFDEPFADSSLLPTYLVSQAIRQHVKVALSGDGGDELFAGYDYYPLVLQEDGWSRVPRTLRAAAAPLHRMLPVGARGKNFLRRLPCDGVKRFLRLTYQPEEITVSPLDRALDRELARLPEDAYRQAVLAELIEPGLNSESSLLQKMTRLDFFSYLPDDILVKVDRTSMFVSLEARAPLLDYRIVEFAFRLPDSLRLKGNTRKYLLKKVARNYLPPDYPYDRKQGFSLPEAEWLQGEWRQVWKDRFSQESKLLDPGKLAKLCEAHDRNGRYGKALFQMLMMKFFEHTYGCTVELNKPTAWK